MSDMAGFAPRHFRWQAQDGVAVITLNRPERKNPLTFESYAELRDCFRALNLADDIKAVVFGSNGGNFCSGWPSDASRRRRRSKLKSIRRG